MGLFYSRPLPPTLITPEPGTLGTAPFAMGPVKINQSNQPSTHSFLWEPQLPHILLPVGTTIKFPIYAAPLPPPSNDPGPSPPGTVWPSTPPPLGNGKEDTLYLSNSSSFPICWLHCTRIIIKHLKRSGPSQGPKPAAAVGPARTGFGPLWSSGSHYLAQVTCEE